MYQAIFLSLLSVSAMNAHNSRKLLDAPYFYAGRAISWDASKTLCESLGARLATFHSLQDIVDMSQTCLGGFNLPSHKHCYTGWSNHDRVAPFEFVTGEKMNDLGAWGYGGMEPNDQDNHHCGCVASGVDTTKIYDCVCSYSGSLGVVCEWADELECGEGNFLHQIGDLNADIAGDGIGVTYDTATVQECMAECRDDDACKAYSWAPKGGDVGHIATTVCTLYDTDTATGQAGPNQVLCQPCYKDAPRAESVGVLSFISRQLSKNPSQSFDVGIVEVSAISGAIAASFIFVLWLSVYYLCTRCICRRKMENWEKVADDEVGNHDVDVKLV